MPFAENRLLDRDMAAEAVAAKQLRWKSAAHAGPKIYDWAAYKAEIWNKAAGPEFPEGYCPTYAEMKQYRLLSDLSYSLRLQNRGITEIPVFGAPEGATRSVAFWFKAERVDLGNQYFLTMENPFNSVSDSLVARNGRVWGLVGEPSWGYQAGVWYYVVWVVQGLPGDQHSQQFIVRTQDGSESFTAGPVIVSGLNTLLGGNCFLLLGSAGDVKISDLVVYQGEISQAVIDADWKNMQSKDSSRLLWWLLNGSALPQVGGVAFGFSAPGPVWDSQDVPY